MNNAASVHKIGKMWDIDVEDFDNVIDTNIKGMANVLRHFIPLLIPKRVGIIVNMSSEAGRVTYEQVCACLLNISIFLPYKNYYFIYHN